MAVALTPGNRLPDFELPDHRGERRRLSTLQGENPLILVIARGHFCPKDQQQHRLLAAFYPEIAVAYTGIVTVSTDPLPQLNALRQSTGAQWTFLSDAEREMQRALDLEEYTDPVHRPMIPHTLVLAPGLEIFRVYNGYWYWGRPSPEDLRRDLRALSEQIRPDWDIRTPELRANWAGDRRLHYPYRPRSHAPGSLQEGVGNGGTSGPPERFV
ncbi:MAG: redoxin domain-containing protein [Firmicutes bacterium]|nr:redoxin domain-containing protein [Alicyclobacillaceae bacterium]MCL6497349.1 redoxin domain-containing protein [Bacillota bacterium]